MRHVCATYAALLLGLAPSALAGCGSSSNDDGQSTNQNDSGSLDGRAGGGSGAGAEQIPLADEFLETPTGPVNGLLDAPVAAEFCGNPNDPASQRPVGTVVRVPKTLRYFVCVGSLGDPSATLILTNVPGDQVQGFVPYAALFKYSDDASPNLQRTQKGSLNYVLLVIDLLGSQADSQCKSSNNVFSGLRVGGATRGLCANVPTPYREEGNKRYVDVTFPDGKQQSFELEPVPFAPLPS